MDRPGERLKRARERLQLTYREVEKASQEIAARRGSDEFIIPISRLADIENKGTLPTIYRIYTLCAIYRLDFDQVLQWYGVPREFMASDAFHLGLAQTHAIQFGAQGDGIIPLIPQSKETEIDLGRTTFLSHLIRRWGKSPFQFLSGLDIRQHRYGLIGLEDWSMHPILRPGSLVVIDDSRRKIAPGGWTSEHDRPIYFLETRQGYICGWCALSDGQLSVQPHPSSQQQPRSFHYPSEVDILGQVIGVAMFLETKKRHPRSAAVPAVSPNP
jgi:transcriptional regulator with XRE-family HTH domain